MPGNEAFCREHTDHCVRLAIVEKAVGDIPEIKNDIKYLMRNLWKAMGAAIVLAPVVSLIVAAFLKKMGLV